MLRKSFIGKAFSIVASISLAMSAFPLNASAEREVLGYMGDINHDMLVNTADLVTLSRYLLGTGSLDGGEYNADLDKDGYIDSFDLVMLRQYVIGIKEKEPILGEEITTTTTTTTITTTTTTEQPVETTTTTIYYEEDEFIDAPIKRVEAYLPSQGEGNLVIFYVDFPDCKYDYAPFENEINEIAFGEEDLSDANYPFDSMSAFYARSSKGAMKLRVGLSAILQRKIRLHTILIRLSLLWNVTMLLKTAKISHVSTEIMTVILTQRFSLFRLKPGIPIGGRAQVLSDVMSIWLTE